ncbi:Organic solvents resistance ABC-type transport system, periplasmic component [Methylacidimicrobium sp. AP8]|uniref:MlaD family protein n=1 Tax=Methylacidimicrobium sp. AP8 TaxID=2730359 RepID=UPI0018C1445E|nr:MlaD family protein [Methylacidimicrobium sp. AP8]CAB4243040.1 Organic solvents resistance ABC-type transport system, periplasmic component [Methylacidimicrobium sp. AP8]
MGTKHAEFQVGFFLLTGLVVIGVLIVLLGRYGEKFRPTYEITVEFPNAYGLVKGAPVQFAGAPVGRVAASPYPIREGRAVEVRLKLYADAKIRKDALFQIVDVGMLGDKSIEITPRGTSAPFLKAGDHVRGSRQTTIVDLAGEFRPVAESAGKVADEIGTLMGRINEEVLTPEVAAEIRATIKDLHSVIARTDHILEEAQYGRGPISRLLNDPALATDLRDFIYNLRRKGVLFYSDVAGRQEQEGKPLPVPATHPVSAQRPGTRPASSGHP